MGLLRSAARASITSTSGVATPEKWLVDWVKGGIDTPSGVDVTVDTALMYAPFFAAVRVLAEDEASLPLHLYERLDPRGKRRATDHPVYGLLHDAPNDLMGSMQLRETAMGHAVTWGDGLVYVVRRRGTPVELWPLRPDRVEIKVDRDGPGRRRVRYVYRDEVNGIYATLLPDEVLHISGLGFDGLRGYSLVSLARNSIGLGVATEAFGSRWFRDGSRPSGVLTSDKALSEGARSRMRSDWESLHKGLDRSQRIAILEEGTSWQQMGIPPEDAQFLETRRFQVNELVRWTRVPPHKLGDLERATFSNIEHQSLDYVTSALRPWLVRWEQAIWLTLLNDEERDSLFAEHLVDAFLRGDMRSRSEALAVQRNWGIISADDWREIENMNPLPDGKGEDYLVPLNMVPVDASSADGGDGRADAKVRSGIRSAEGRRRIADRFGDLIADVDERMAKMERAEVGSLVRRHLEEDRGRTRSTSAFLGALQDLYQGPISERATDRWLPLMTTFAREIAAAASDDIGAQDPPDLERWVRSYVESHLAYRISSAIGQLRAVLDEEEDAGNAAAALNHKLDEWVEERPGRTAKWEKVQLSEGAARETWRESGVQRMRWVGGGCPYCEELDGQVVGIEQTFMPAGSTSSPTGLEEQLQVDRDTFHPPLHPGCDCSIVPD